MRSLHRKRPAVPNRIIGTHTRRALADSMTRFQLGDAVFGTCPRLLADSAAL
jgi:hypothetical protein